MRGTRPVGTARGMLGGDPRGSIRRIWPDSSIDGPAFYMVHVSGTVDPSCDDLLAGMSIEIGVGRSILCGHLANQAALLDVLNMLAVLGYDVVSIECGGPAGIPT